MKHRVVFFLCASTQLKLNARKWTVDWSPLRSAATPARSSLRSAARAHVRRAGRRDRRAVEDLLEPRALQAGLEIGGQVLAVLGRVVEGEGLGVVLHEEVERVHRGHVGHQVHLHLADPRGLPGGMRNPVIRHLGVA